MKTKVAPKVFETPAARRAIILTEIVACDQVIEGGRPGNVAQATETRAALRKEYATLVRDAQK